MPALDSIISAEALYVSPFPRLSRPPFALQTCLLDILNLINHEAVLVGDLATIRLVGSSAMGLWSGVSCLGDTWAEKVLHWWEGYIRTFLDVGLEVRKGIDRGCQIDGQSMMDSSDCKTVPTIQVSDLSQSGSCTDVPRKTSSGWHLHPPSPTSAIKIDSGSRHPPQQISSILSAQTTSSLIPSLLSHLLETFPFPIETPTLASIHRFHHLIELITLSKPDVHLDLLEIVCRGSERARFGAVALLHSFYPESMGHLTVTKPLPIISYEESLYLREKNRSTSVSLSSTSPSPSQLILSPPLPEIPCIFPSPSSIEDTSILLEILVGSIEACLKDVDVSINEAGLQFVKRFCHPNGGTHKWVMIRVVHAILTWVLEEVSFFFLSSLSLRAGSKTGLFGASVWFFFSMSKKKGN